MNALPEADGDRPDEAGYAFSSACTCPRCDGSAYRVHRRAVDLLMSMFITLSRYRCRSMDCGWEGNLRANRHPLLLRGCAELQERGPAAAATFRAAATIRS